ncbi:DUF3616 domain-containing protein [Bradyrhizobium sp. AUGA SZCCT0176]|uniref:DUF3616 domain-containing protein n=1 Tax=Bradyrhizobium sp. AUGA SZCCT0176 TaxID=2807664 RepID=UPI001BAC1088|nr:DUF3616 domain-containing protein [Bradyrhizobium sp. AUGA SZCCT0176]MBR1225200.1 DUF3616 domain-containing protein [Bradyrhizobium sp. AUGA SZCCT0176]
MKNGFTYAICAATSLLSGAATAADSTITTYREMCDASASVALDADHFVVADDEMNVLRVYRRGQPSSVAQVDLSKFLDTKPDKESDLEGAARVGNTIFWISSHGTNSEGKVQDRRRRFFATELVPGSSPPTVRPVGKPYSKLVEDLSKLTQYKLGEAATKPPKTVGALNIEGLADGGDGRLLIGFRNPLPGNKALIIPLKNPTVLVDEKPEVREKAEASFGNPIELDLKGRGIRSIERVGSTYLIVAGPIDGKGDFKLFRWSGKESGEDLELVDTPSLKGLSPEAMFAISETGEVQILSDDGTFPVGGGECKDVPRTEQSFRSVILKP